MDQLLIIQITLVSIGLIGAFDEYVYHFKLVNLLKQPNSRTENILHILRQFIFSLIFFITACISPNGNYSLGLILLLALDIVIGFADVIVEPRSRNKLGGLPAGEYFLHMLLSFLLGIFHFNYISFLVKTLDDQNSWSFTASLNSPIQLILLVMAIFSLLIAIFGAKSLLQDNRP